jgi:hypothetical protein
MKSILYVGATLMIGASIYGFVDYKQTSRKKEFKEMYVDEKVKEPVVVSPVVKTEPVVTDEGTTRAKTTVVKKKVSKAEEVIVAPVKPIAEDAKLTPDETINIETANVTTNLSKEDVAKNTIKKRKRINARLFSRAPLREDNEDVPKPVKESKKTKE